MRFKPCPFCGEKKDLVLFKALNVVQCNNCEARGPRTKSRKEAIARWDACERKKHND